jgi:hypothetical protein
MNPLDHALDLAGRGIPAFPCRVDKKPACPHGFKDASTDAGTLRYLWGRYPGPLVGVPTGEPSGLFIVDVDSARHEEASDWLERWAPHLPGTRQHLTKSGGYHLLFKHRTGLKNTAGKLAKGVDTRGDGGYIVWWPAIGLWANKAGLAPVPDFLVDALKPSAEPVVDYRRAMPRTHDDVWLRGLVRAVVFAGEGQRNAVLFWAACRAGEAIRDGRAAKDFVEAVLIEAAVTAGWPLRGAVRTVTNGLRKGGNV